VVRSRKLGIAELETRDGRQLQPLLLAEIRRELARLEFLLAQIAELDPSLTVSGRTIWWRKVIPLIFR